LHYFLVVLVLLISACTDKDSLHRWTSENLEPEYTQLRGRVVAVEIVDSRPDTTSRPLNVPKMSLPWNDDEVAPSLTIGHRGLIESEVAKYFSGGDEVTVRVEIRHWVQRFVANWWSEGEEAECELAIDILSGGQSLAGGSAVGGAEVKLQSLDAGQATIEEIYVRVIAASISQCMKEYSKRLAAQSPGA
jgi:hypothetical protein